MALKLFLAGPSLAGNKTPQSPVYAHGQPIVQGGWKCIGTRDSKQALAQGYNVSCVDGGQKVTFLFF